MDKENAEGPRETATGFRVEVKHWRAVAKWSWNAKDDLCGICRISFDGCAPESKYPGDDSPVVWGACSHPFHLQCITKWVRSQGPDQRCPICRQPWEFKSAEDLRSPQQRLPTAAADDDAFQG